jgi:tetratricopeptide (TPR) repeat protein
VRRRDRGSFSAGSSSALAAFSIGCFACAPAHGALYETHRTAGGRAEGAGRFEEAARDYDAAQRAATRAQDRDQARWDAAEMVARTGDVAAAASRFDAIALDATSEHQAEAAYRLANLRIRSGDPDRGWRDMEQVPRHFSGHGIAHVAVRQLVQHADENGVRVGLDELRALERDLGSTELGPLLAFLHAEHLEALGDDHGAREAFGRIADRWPYPFGAFFDDSLWHASLIDGRLGLYQNAIDDLERLLRERETTSLVGSYERARYVPAMLRVAALYRDALHDRARARDAFHRFYVDFTHSTLRDRALWLEAELWREDGDATTACERLGTLIEKFPDSRYVPCAMQPCPMLRRPPASAAPRECHAYIARETER